MSSSASGPCPIGDIRTEHVEQVLRPIWLAKPETARRVKQRIAAILGWATVAGYRSENLANAAIAVAPALQKQPRRDHHHPAVPWQEVPAFLDAMRTCDSRDAVKLALEFTILTASRSCEVLGATWDEIDFGTKVWTIPAERMKMREKHVVPLSEHAYHLLLAAKSMWPASPYLFPGRRWGEPLSNMGMLMVMRRMGARKSHTAFAARSAPGRP